MFCFVLFERKCNEYCYQTQVVKNCSCYNTGFPSLDFDLPCTSYEQIRCAAGIWSELFSDEHSQICEGLCPLECDSEDLSFSISSKLYPTNSYANSIKKLSLIKVKHLIIYFL